jgi:hypothetical protein
MESYSSGEFWSDNESGSDDDDSDSTDLVARLRQQALLAIPANFAVPSQRRTSPSEQTPFLPPLPVQNSPVEGSPAETSTPRVAGQAGSGTAEMGKETAEKAATARVAGPPLGSTRRAFGFGSPAGVVSKAIEEGRGTNERQAVAPGPTACKLGAMHAPPVAKTGLAPGAKTGLAPGAKTGLAPGAKTGLAPGAKPATAAGESLGASPIGAAAADLSMAIVPKPVSLLTRKCTYS